MFGRNKRNKETVVWPDALQAESPVNYDSVLDYLVGLSQKDYDKLLKVSNIYREANKNAAKVLGVRDQPTTQLKDEKPSDEDVDDALDIVLDSAATNFLDDDLLESPEPKKDQAPTTKKKTPNES